jgi:hypothetical protein
VHRPGIASGLRVTQDFGIGPSIELFGNFMPQSGPNGRIAERVSLLLVALALFGLLPLCAQDPAAALEHARTVNLERAASMPNFVVDETAIRYHSPHTEPPKWKLFDKIDMELIVQGAGWGQRQNVRRNGKPWPKPDFSDFGWGEQFGSELTPLFDSKCQTTIEFDGHEQANGRQMLAYRFRSPPGSCFGFFVVTRFFSTQRFNPERTGRFVIDEATGSVISSVIQTKEYPKGFAADPSESSTTWDYVKIGDTAHLLPVSAEVFGGFTKGDLWHVVIEYKNHRHFESATSISFGPEAK